MRREAVPIVLVAVVAIVAIMSMLSHMPRQRGETLVGQAGLSLMQEASTPDGGQLLLGDSSSKMYIYSGGLIASIDSDDKMTYYGQDFLSSNRFVVDDEGKLVSKYASYPYGKTLTKQSFASDVQKYTFTGKEEDAETLMYFGARYMNPRTGRFASVDPITRVGSNYAYGANNPLKFVDPSGMTETDPQLQEGYFDNSIAQMRNENRLQRSRSVTLSGSTVAAGGRKPTQSGRAAISYGKYAGDFLLTGRVAAGASEFIQKPNKVDPATLAFTNRATGSGIANTLSLELGATKSIGGTDYSLSLTGAKTVLSGGNYFEKIGSHGTQFETTDYSQTGYSLGLGLELQTGRYTIGGNVGTDQSSLSGTQLYGNVDPTVPARGTSDFSKFNRDYGGGVEANIVLGRGVAVGHGFDWSTAGPPTMSASAQYQFDDLGGSNFITAQAHFQSGSSTRVAVGVGHSIDLP